jgi:hypothetical protein
MWSDFVSLFLNPQSQQKPQSQNDTDYASRTYSLKSTWARRSERVLEEKPPDTLRRSLGVLRASLKQSRVAFMGTAPRTQDVLRSSQQVEKL